MEIYQSQSNSAAGCFLHDCRGRADFSFEGKQRQVLTVRDTDEKLKELPPCLLCPEKNVTGACMPWRMNQNKNEATGSLHSSPSVHPGFWRCLCCGKRGSLSLGSSCRNETKCNKNLVVCARSHGGLSRDCWNRTLKSHNTQLSGNNDFHSLSKLFWWLRGNKSHCHLSILFGFNCILLSHWFPLTLLCYNSWCFKFFHF